MKHLHRLIVTSQAYRMRSTDAGPGDPNVALDPDNRYLWRMNVRRMEGGGRPRQRPASSPAGSTPRSAGPTSPSPRPRPARRRTLYYRYASGDRIPFLTMFDAASVRSATDATRRSCRSRRWH